jgi:hypothetical protein
MVKLPYYVELYDIAEFSRLVCALENPTYIILICS